MKNIKTVLITVILLLALVACSGAAVQPAAQTGAAAATSAPSGATATPPPAVSSTEALAENSPAHDSAAAAVWESASEIPIRLDGDTIAVEGAGVIVDGSSATITAAGTYSLSGALADGQIIVDTADDGIVRLILNGVDIHSSSGAPITVLQAKSAAIILADNSENTVSDGAAYVFAEGADEPNAAIFSAADLTIAGGGALSVQGNYNDGISSKDGLIVSGGTITVQAADDGIRGKDYLVVEDGSISVAAQGDGLKSDNSEDATRGYISIESGTVSVTAAGDALDAATDVMITGGTFTLTAGGGSSGQIAADSSAKGIKADVQVTIDGGTFSIDAAEDALHANGGLTVNGGTFALASGDDGIHADAAVTINAGDIQISESYEGIESAVITINGGAIHLVAQDDGINVAAESTGAGMGGGRPGRGQSQGGAAYTGANYLYINGGYLVVDAAGDGLDSNGAIKMTGGVVLVNGPTESMNGALDYDGGFSISGGVLVAAGSAGMATAPDSASSQYSVLINFTATQAAGTLVQLQSSDGASIVTFAPSKPYQSIVISAPELASGATYTLYSGGSATGSVTDGLYQHGDYVDGAEYASVTLTDVVTQIGSRGR